MTLALNPSSGGANLATDVVGGDHHQVVKLALGNSTTANPVSTSNPVPVQGTPPPFWRVGFAEGGGSGLQGLAANEITLMQMGPGMSIAQMGGNLVIMTGITVNSETVLRSKLAFRGSLLARYKAILFQRIANQVVRFELADLIGTGLAYTINSATSVTVTFPTVNPFTAAHVGQSLRLSVITGAAGIPGRYAIASVSGLTVTFNVAGWPATGTGTLTLYGHNWMANEYSGTTATNSSFDCQRRGWASGNTTATINTTDAPGHVGQIAFDVLSASFSDAPVASSTAFQWASRATRIENIPDEDVDLYLFIVVQNGTVAPVSNNVLTVGFVQVEGQTRDKVRITSSDPVNANPSPVQIMGGTASVTGTVTASPSIPGATIINSASTTNGTVIQASAVTLMSLNAFNGGAAACFLKLHNSATVTPGVTAVALTIPLPPGALTQIDCGVLGLRFNTGLCISITNLVADGDTTSIAAGQVKLIIGRA